MRVAVTPTAATRHLTARLFAKYAVISLLPVFLLGLVLAAYLSDQAHQRELLDARSQATLVAQTAVEPLLDGRPLSARLSATEGSRLRAMTARATAGKLILALGVGDLAGQVVFPAHPSRAAADAPADARRAARGETVATLLPAGPLGPRSPASFAVYAPLYAGAAHRLVGVLAVQLPYAPILAAVTPSMQRMDLYLALGLALLYLALFAITLSVSRGLRRHVAVNAAQAEQLRTSALEHRLLFEENPQPMIAFDRQTLQIVAVSNATVAHYGYSREELLTMRILDLHPAEDVPALRTRLEAAGRTAPSGLHSLRQTRWRHQYKDGTIIDVEISGDDVMLSGRDCRIVLCQDVTERNRAIAELAVARDAAVAASNTKSAFLANMSHEIRTPMNGVIGMSELLADSGLNEEQQSYADHIVRSGEQMLAIINDILDISKIETGQLDLDLTDFGLHETIEEACATGAIQAKAKGIELKVEIADAVPRYVRGDSGRLRQVILNLLANAVKFTGEGAVTVRADAPRTGADGTLVRIEVADTGIGIEPDALERMFEPFTQADVSTTRNYGGTGLGLAIARELTELMGGTIGVESIPGEGSVFSFEVTLAAAINEQGPVPAPRPVRAPAVALGPDAPLVLVADDTPVNQIVAVRALQRCGCRSHVVNDGYEALAAVLTQRYAAILMDCQMPEMDGYETTGELRRREAGGHRTPVIAMTAHAMKGDLEKCLAAGMDDYISKPLRHQALLEVLERWIPELAASAGEGGGGGHDGEERPPVAATASTVDAL